MPGLVEVLIEDPRWRPAGIEALAATAARAALARLGLPAEGFEISLLACDDARIAALNAAFRGKAAPTDVLSWPAAERGAAGDGGRPDLPVPGAADDPESLGDIALAWETCSRDAAAAGRPLSDHLSHLVVHGVLHLLGYDHIRPADAALMEGLEVEILARLGVADPYR
ncbi:MAG: rRNA maturation RNase YbeY [Rhodobacteraceae bacterium]|jgi:probable rRNA maturation factor|nr:rRNA maturation RNase YbeY [Paracoccaceae bacterium]